MGKVEKNADVGDIVKMSDGKITIPKETRDNMNIGEEGKILVMDNDTDIDELTGTNPKVKGAVIIPIHKIVTEAE